jgi:hypothetical protein
MAYELLLPVPKGFQLCTAVCSYGFFMLVSPRWLTGFETASFA